MSRDKIRKKELASSTDQRYACPSSDSGKVSLQYIVSLIHIITDSLLSISSQSRGRLFKSKSRRRAVSLRARGSRKQWASQLEREVKSSSYLQHKKLRDEVSIDSKHHK